MKIKNKKKSAAGAQKVTKKTAAPAAVAEPTEVVKPAEAAKPAEPAKAAEVVKAEPAKAAEVVKAAPAKAAEVVKAAPKSTKKSVTFSVHAGEGKAVYVAGEFNGWDPTAKKMAYKAGVYTATVSLEPGSYQYKYVIDGTWCADPENVNSVANDQGTFNSIVTVK